MADFISPADLHASEIEFERRHGRRSKKGLLVAYRAAGRMERPFLTVSDDVSDSGIAMRTFDVLPKDLFLNLRFCRPGSLEVFRARGRVCWSRPREAGAGATTGVAVVVSEAPLLT